MTTFNMASWMFWALFTAFGFVSALKRWTERTTERSCARRKLRRARAAEKCAREQRELAERELREAALATPVDEPEVIYTSAPRLVPQSAPLPPAPQLELPAAIERPARPGLTAFRAAPLARTA